MSRFTYLSYILDKNTPTYGNKNSFLIDKKSSIKNGDIANDSSIATTVHIGTHIDMPYHFYKDGQTIEDYDIDFFIFKNPLVLEIIPKSLIIYDEIVEGLDSLEDKERYDILIVKTGICYKREVDEFWEKNFGFDPKLASYFREQYPNIRVFGFDSISVSSFQERMIGREAHKAFLSPSKPILLLEDMDLRAIEEGNNFKKIVIAPLRIAECDGLPCTVIGEIE